MNTKTYNVRITYHFSKGGAKSKVYEIQAPNKEEAVFLTREKFYEEIGTPIPDGQLSIDYVFERN